MAGKRTTRAKGKAPRKPKRIDPAEAMRRQLAIREIVALTVAPGFGLELEDAEAIARRVVRDHPKAAVVELAPIVLAHVDRFLAEVAA